MTCIAGEGPFTPSSVRVCAMSHEPYPGPALLDLLAGPIPWPIIGARILKFNPTLSPEQLVGAEDASEARGGLAMTSILNPVHGAVALDLDVRNPWTSIVHLVARLRGFTDYRLARYANLWKEVFSSETFDGWPHVFAPCIHFADQTLYQQASITAGQAGLHVLHQWPFYQDGTIMYHQGGYVDRGWDRFYHGPLSQQCCSNCSNNASFNLTGITAGMPVLAMRQWKNYCQCGGFLDQLRSEMLSRIALLYNQPAPVDWPRHLLQDPGFWVLVLAEESLSSAAMNWLWSLLLDGGLPKLLGNDDAATALSAGMLMAHGGQVLGRNLYATLVDRLESHDGPVPGIGVSVPDIISQLESAAQIVFDAYAVEPAGIPRIPFFDVSQPAGPTAWINSLNASTFRGSRSSTFLNWLGGVHIEVPSPIPPGVKPPPLVPEPEEMDPEAEPIVVPPPARGPADRSSLVGPIVFGGSVLLAGGLLIQAIRVHRRRVAAQRTSIAPSKLFEVPVSRPRKRGSRKRRGST